MERNESGPQPIDSRHEISHLKRRRSRSRRRRRAPSSRNWITHIVWLLTSAIKVNLCALTNNQGQNLAAVTAARSVRELKFMMHESSLLEIYWSCDQVKLMLQWMGTSATYWGPPLFSRSPLSEPLFRLRANYKLIWNIYSIFCSSRNTPLLLKNQ